jgi:hypothetical protein
MVRAMHDYEELVRELRGPVHSLDCEFCNRKCCYPDGASDDKCVIIQAADAIEELVSNADKFKWISVEDRLPKYGDWVMGIGPKKGYYICEYRGVTHFPYEGDVPWFAAKGRCVTVTHWMPLPEPPKEADAID